MYCGNCGKELPAKAKFCSSCGTLVSNAKWTPKTGDDFQRTPKLRILAAVAAVIIAVICGVVMYLSSDTKQLQRQLELGQKYLVELDYEQAVVEFEKAIKIDPMSVDAYLGLAEAYEGMGNDDMATQVLEQGYNITGDERLLDALEAKKNIKDVGDANILEIDIEDDSNNNQNIISEDELKKILEKEVSEPIVNFIYDDFDYNGTYEAIALCGEAYLDEEYPEFSTYSGTLYFVTEDGVEVFRSTDDYWTNGDTFDLGDTKIIYINKYSATSAVSYLYQVKEDKIIEIEGSGKGCDFSQDEAGWFCMTDSQYDASVDGTGHTWNVYYFYWDDGLHEYGGTLMSRDDFSSYSGASAILRQIEDDGYDIKSIYKRPNGIININCSDETSNANVRVFLENENVEVMPVIEDYFYEAGIIKPALIPEIAIYSSSDSDKKINVYDAYDVIINEYKAACAIDSADWQANADNYPDLDQYVLADYHTPLHADYIDDDDIIDEPYEIAYSYYDIDHNSIPELLLWRGYHEAYIFAIYVFDGKKAVELGFAGQSQNGFYNIYTNGVVEFNYGWPSLDYFFYILNRDGYTLEQIEISYDDMVKLLQYYPDYGKWTILAYDVPAE